MPHDSVVEIPYTTNKEMELITMKFLNLCVYEFLTMAGMFLIISGICLCTNYGEYIAFAGFISLLAGVFAWGWESVNNR